MAGTLYLISNTLGPTEAAPGALPQVIPTMEQKAGQTPFKKRVRPHLYLGQNRFLAEKNESDPIFPIPNTLGSTEAAPGALPQVTPTHGTINGSDPIYIPTHGTINGSDPIYIPTHGTINGSDPIYI
jgi:hypothetical protein